MMKIQQKIKKEINKIVLRTVTLDFYPNISMGGPHLPF